MKDESGFSSLPIWVKEWFAIAFVICIILGSIAWHLAKTDSNAWGAVGDLSGWASTLVSAFGFVFIYYQLRQHHEDSKKAEERHVQSLEAQEEFFKQNARIALFDKRVQVYDAVKKLLLAGFGNNLNEEKIQNLHLAIQHSRFLFPEDSKLDEYIDRIHRSAVTLNFLEKKQKRIQEAFLPLRPLEPSEIKEMEDLILWFSEQYRNGINAVFVPYLSISTFDNQFADARY